MATHPFFALLYLRSSPKEADLCGQWKGSIFAVPFAVPLLSGLLQKKLEGGGESQQRVEDRASSRMPHLPTVPRKAVPLPAPGPCSLLLPDFPLLSLAWLCAQSQDS